MWSPSRFSLGVWLLAIAGFPAFVHGQPAGPPSLGAAASFAVLGGSSVTSSGSTVVTGNLGVSPGNTVTGFPPGIVKVGATFRNDSTTRQAQRDAAAAYADLAGRACGSDLSGQDLGGRTLGSGVYCFSSSAQLTGTLILDAANDPKAVWIFRIGSALTATPDSSVLVAGGGYESNVFWQVGGAAVLGARTSFVGNVLASTSITMNEGASESGRLLALTGSVALDTNNVSLCCDPITLSPQTLPDGLAGTIYNQTLIAAKGGTGQYAFSVTSGSLPDGLNLINTPSAGVISGTPTKKGVFTLTVTAADSHGCTGTQVYTIPISPIPCQTITVTNPPIAAGFAGAFFKQTFMQSGAVGTATFTTTSPLPAGLVLSSSGLLSGTPTQSGSFPIVVTVTDSNGCAANGPTYNLTITPCQITVTAASPLTPNGTVLVPFSQLFTQMGGIGATTFTTTSPLPAGLTLSSGGLLSGTPAQIGSFPIVVMATDSNGCAATGPTYNLMITCQTITVTAASPLTPNGTVSVPFSQQFAQTGAIGGATFTTTSPLPAGLVLSSGGLLSGTPMQAGSFPIVVTVTDGNHCTGMSATYPLVVGCQIITVANPPITAGAVSSPFNQTFTQTGGIGATNFTTDSPLPAGLTLSNGGVLSGTPTQTGSFPIVVSATDSNGCTGSGPTYPLIINPCASVTLSPATLPGPAVGAPYNETISASGGTAPYMFLVSGTLPPGLTFLQTTATTATISGTPTTNGVFTFCITVTDANLCTVTQCYTMVLAAGGATLSGWGMIVLSILLVGAGIVMIQKKGV